MVDTHPTWVSHLIGRDWDTSIMGLSSYRSWLVRVRCQTCGTLSTSLYVPAMKAVTRASRLVL